MRLIDEDKVISVIERFIGYIDEDMIERIKIAIKKSVPTAASELTVESDPIIKRLRHLLESEYIRSFDEVDPRTQEYKRDIREADKGRAAPETAPFRSYGEMTIYGYKVTDLVILAQTLRNTGLEVEDLKDSNKVFISGAKYAIEQYNKEIEKSFTAHIEDIILGDDKSDKLLKEGKEAAKRWNKRQEEGKQ